MLRIGFFNARLVESQFFLILLNEQRIGKLFSFHMVVLR